MAFAKLLRNLLRDKDIGERVVPIIPDEARTFGMDPLFKEVGIYSALGQLYEPVDSNLVLSYREAKDGQVLEEGITEAGSSASFQAAGTSYATHAEPMIPFYIFYSMFGFQRTGDEFWAFGDARGRGFLLGATAGRTTLNGEGCSTRTATRSSSRRPSPRSASTTRRSPTRRRSSSATASSACTARAEDVFYYLTLYNENYAMPARPEGVTDEDILRASTGSGAGRDGGTTAQALAMRATLLASGSIMQQALRAQADAGRASDVAADVWSAPSYQLLRNEAPRGRALEPAPPRRAAARGRS